MAAHKPSPDPLYCAEQNQWGESEIEEDEEKHTNNININNNNNDDVSLLPLLLLQQDLFRDDDDLISLFAKEREAAHEFPDHRFPVLAAPRKRAVEWLLRVNSRHGFSPLTAALAVNYLDRFLLLSSFDGTRPWTTQLLAVACLSLAAKVEETHVPLLLDLQMEDAMYVFEAKTIQRMELVVLAGLRWRMNPVTPLCFLDHVIRRLGFKAYFHWQFLATCQNLVLGVISDPRLIHYLPSVFATATMLHVIHRVDPTNGCVYENQLLGVLKLKKEEVDDCYEIISDVMISKNGDGPLKRELGRGPTDDGSLSRDSWASSSSCISTSSPSSSSPPLKKARRMQEQQMRIPSLSRVFVGRPIN